MPWRRAYTLNIDDLEAAASRAFDLPRRIRPVSGLSRSLPLGTGADLLYIHLNGTLADIPRVTFTDPQYGRRHTQANALYDQLAADLMAYPVVFVWCRAPRISFLAVCRASRRARQQGAPEHRRRSYLVTPTLPPDRKRLLQAYNIAWVQATADEFAVEVLGPMGEQAKRGHAVRAAARAAGEGVFLPPVAELAALPFPGDSEYLLGVQPTWNDISSGRAIARDFESQLAVETAEGCLLVAREPPGLVPLRR